MKLKKLIEGKVQRTTLMIKSSSHKIIKKEFRKMERDLKKKLLGKLKKHG